MSAVAIVARLSRLACTVRVGKPDDLAFVVDSWTKHAHRKQRLRTATAHVRALLARAGARLVVAHVPNEPDDILGWVAAEDGKPPCIHYVYVRSVARRQGVAAKMLDASVREAIEHSSPCAFAPAVWKFKPERSVTA